ncbi:MAG: hypothetical protein VXY14_05505 [Candidatus Thermoplasmatota archaeon]|nr:hypothetical protein [Candidatus Thermoplasmatota archaeon]
MVRAVIHCGECGQALSVPRRTGQVECAKCNNLITLKFEPRVVNTPGWFNKKLGFFLMFLAYQLWANNRWLRDHLFDVGDLYEMLAQLLCFAGILVVALTDVVRHRGRLFGDQAYPNPTLESDAEVDATTDPSTSNVAPGFGTKFYLAIVLPLLMMPVSFIVPSVLDWCRHPAFRECNEVGTGAYIFMLFLPFGTALVITTMGLSASDDHDSELLAGAKISGVLTFAFFAMMSFLMMTIHP